jgi:glycosyltransferase involved in cell wall biosynthesis
MTTDFPNVSIGLPVYNGEKYLPAALNSILQQDYTDFELIISDNASTDTTQDICRQFAIKDSRIRYYRNELNIGACENFRQVFKQSRAKYFKWACHDDVHLPGFMRRCVEVMSHASPTVVLVAPRTQIINADGQVIPTSIECLHTPQVRPHQRIAEVLRNVKWATALYGLFRREALEKTRLIDSFFASDRVLLFEAAILGQILEIPEVLFQHRVHPDKSTNINRTPSEFLKWFSPLHNGSGNSFARKRLAVEYVRSIARIPIPIVDRFFCFFVCCSIESRRFTRKYRNKLALKTRFQSLFGG